MKTREELVQYRFFLRLRLAPLLVEDTTRPTSKLADLLVHDMLGHSKRFLQCFKRYFMSLHASEYIPVKNFPALSTRKFDRSFVNLDTEQRVELR